MIDGVGIYRISDAAYWSFGDSMLIGGPRIHGDWLVWISGGQVMLYNLSDLGSAVQAQPISGPGASMVEIGDQFVVWVESQEITVWDIAGSQPTVVGTPDSDTMPTTHGAWVAWVAGNGPTRIEAVNMDDPALSLVSVVNDGSLNVRPSIHGDLIAWESNAAGNFDIWLYRLSTGETFQVTTDPADQQLADVYGDLVTYVDDRAYNDDVWVSTLEFPPDPCAGAVSGLVACYQFEGNASDGSGNGHHGTIFGSAGFTTDAAGNPDGAIDFDGVDDYVELPDESSFDLSELSIAATLKVQDYARENWVLTKGTGFGNYTLYISDDAAAWPGYAAYTHRLAAGNWSSVVSDSPVPVDEFFHVTVTVSGTEFRAYVNGNLYWSHANPAPPLLNNDAVTIGAGGYYGLSDFFVGAIDDIRIYNRVLSATETCELFNAAVNTAPSADAGADQTVHTGSVVTLDASGSSDPEGNYPLVYLWTLASSPAGSTATLSDPTAVSPSLPADVIGDYTLELVVTDSCGFESAPDTVVISNFNTAPVADAGPDQAVTVLATTVQLDGTQSDDDDGDTLTYMWTICTVPAGSTATLSDPTADTPTFVADAQGNYEIELVVSDEWAQSAPDTVIVSFTNVKPVADADGNQAVQVGETAYLDGSASSDANGDPLTYNWSFVSTPAGSTAMLAGAATSAPSFAADVAGTYVVSLVVNDGLIDSDPNNVTVTATTSQETVILILQEAVVAINNFDEAVFEKKKRAKKLTKKINAALEKIDKGKYEDAIKILEHHILQRIDGCAETGEPDRKDWIVDCEAQGDIYPVIVEAIDLLLSLTGGG